MLPWDNTGGRLSGEPWGSGTPGVPNRGKTPSGEKKYLHANPPENPAGTMGANDLYWWREKKWNRDAGSPAAGQRMPEWLKAMSPDPEIAHRRLGQALRDHPNAKAASVTLKITADQYRGYLRRNGLTTQDLKNLPPPP